ncbi:MAG TPA: uroporphyrinogen-III C-methyltransferase [Chloroflexota bacterium]|nr:uroporphyrinogen-III C-methyltransferase [Chloroflexota bacterium]
MSSGAVYLVGGGPGDPGLLTLKGKRLLEEADVVVYDYLIDEQLLVHAHHAELIPARDLHGNRAEQQRINELLIEHAHKGKKVVRLKGGDPYLFGRGGEEGEALQAAGIRFQVVPGVTSALAAPAYAGIPVTHREHSSSVTILTGSMQRQKDQQAIDWPALARGADTLVLLMAMTNLEEVVERLIENGLSGDTPAAAIRWGSRPDQQVATASLRDLPRQVREQGLRAPAVVVVGEVVALREQLDWFEQLPLFGVGVLVTRAREQSAEFSDRLRETGARVYQAPVINIRSPEDWTGVDAAIDQLAVYDWLVFTSANGVRLFCDRVWAKGGDARAFGHARLCAIGPETARSLHAFGLRADLVPTEYVAEAVAAALQPYAPKKVLIPRARIARDVLPVKLRQAGNEVDVVEVYRTEIPESAGTRLRTLLDNGEIDVVTFTSSSTVTNFVQLAGHPPAGVKVACIGPITAQTAEAHGLTVDITAQEYTTAGLGDALCAHFSALPASARAGV